MMNVKTVGVLDESGTKNYLITNKDTGEAHTALAVGSGKFCVGMHKGSLKSCKELVSSGSVIYSWDKQPTSDDENEDGITRPGTFECLDPCAALILWGDCKNKHVLEILDCSGWLDRTGEIMVGEAELALEEWETKLDAN